MEVRGRGNRNEEVVVGVHRSLWEGAVSHLQSRGGTFAVESVGEEHASEGDYQMGGLSVRPKPVLWEVVSAVNECGCSYRSAVMGH